MISCCDMIVIWYLICIHCALHLTSFLFHSYVIIIPVLNNLFFSWWVGSYSTYIISLLYVKFVHKNLLYNNIIIVCSIKNVFIVHYTTFICFRLSKVATVQLIEELKHFMPVLQRRTAIPQHLQVNYYFFFEFSFLFFICVFNFYDFIIGICNTLFLSIWFLSKKSKIGFSIMHKSNFHLSFYSCYCNCIK